MKTLLKAATILAGVSIGAIAWPTAGVVAQTANMPVGDTPASAQSGAHPSLEGIWEPKMDFRAPRPAPPVLTPGYAKIFADTKAKIASGTLDIGSLCSPPGLTLGIQIIGTIEVIDGPKPNMTILYEYQSQAQRIYTDGRKMPAEVDPSPTGYSVGHWEGDTLVVETSGLSEFTFFDQAGTPHSGDMTLVSRIRRTDPQAMEIQVTATDPKAFTAPYTFTRRYSLVPNGALIPFECENIRNPQNPDGSLGYTFKSNEEVDRDENAKARKK